MSAGSRIEWTETTWNPVTGCDRISRGCDACYALTLAKRLQAMGSPKYQADGDPRTSGPGFGVALHPDALQAPYRWRKPRTVFVNSMSDLFHARVPLDYVQQVFDVMAATPQHTYQILTKRARRLARLADQLQWPPNVWMGVSVEDQETADLRIPALATVPAAVRFLSCEPLLEQVAIDGHLWEPCPCCEGLGHDEACVRCDASNCEYGHIRILDWVIVGGESGPRARPMDPDWARHLRDQCTSNHVPFFFKQIGGRTPKAGGRLLDGRTWDQYPRTLEAAR